MLLSRLRLHAYSIFMSFYADVKSEGATVKSMSSREVEEGAH
jgi:phage terminase small subunit